MTGEKTAKKSRDPIFMICLVIFSIAAVIVIGCTVADDVFPSGDRTASTGDKVSVDYTGTYYDEYGKEYAVVFDTSYSSIAKDDDIAKSNDFTEKSSYSALSFTIGGGTMLKAFENSVIGHKVGDKYTIYLEAYEGYVGAPTVGTLMTKDNKMLSSEIMSKENFSAAYPDVTLTKNGGVTMFETKYGWTAQAEYANNNNSVVVSYLPQVGSSYKVYESGDTVVNYKVTALDDGEITYDIEIKNPVKVGGTAIQMIKLTLGDKTIYITDIDGDEITYKEGAERVNQPLYFEIKVLSIE